MFDFRLGSHESYVRAILAPACAPPEQGGLGYRAVVVNFRGCEYSFSPILASFPVLECWSYLARTRSVGSNASCTPWAELTVVYDGV